ncbi:MAG: hypothetical protein KGI69_03335 [Patescibacteria group bacterium]|nr:hypothetical protein [Patescibacteria group bacterium]
MNATIRIMHAAKAVDAGAWVGRRIEQVLPELWYPSQGHGSWRFVMNELEVPPDATIVEGAEIKVFHRAAGDPIAA